MAIYKGSFKDASGVDFDPAVFVIKQHSSASATIVVGGEATTPDCHGTYEYVDQHDDLPYFKHPTEEFYWYFAATPEKWCICATLNNDPTDYWEAADQGWGGYENEGACIGDPTVTLGDPCILQISGDLDPDASGNYHHVGTYHENPYWQNEAETLFLYTDGDHWYIHPELESRPDDSYFSTHESPWDSGWEAQAPYTGAPNSNPTTPAGVPTHGVLRRRVFRSIQTGPHRAGYYPAGPGWNAGIYRTSPAVLTSRAHWAFMMKAYDLLWHDDARRVNTHCEAIEVTGDPWPPCEGRYNQLFPPPSMSPWKLAGPDWILFWHGTDEKWYISKTYPTRPLETDDYWYREDVAFYGTYQAGPIVVGHPYVRSVTYDGVYHYVGEHNELPHYVNPARQAHIWWSDNLGRWILSTVFPQDPGGSDTWWKKAGGTAEGAYEWAGIAEGTAIVDTGW